MRKRTFILLLCAWFWGTTSGWLCAAPTNTDTLSIEEQQQFLYYFYEAQRLIQSKQIELARPVVEFCYELYPYDATVNNYMGLYARMDSNMVASANFFRRAYELDPNEYWYNHIVLMLKSDNKKKHQQAIKQLETLAKNNTKDEELHNILQRAYIMLEQYQKALNVQDQLDSINGYNEMSAMQRYRLNAAMKNNQQAIYEIERFLEMEPDNHQFQVFRMQLYEQTQQPPAKMIEAYEAVLKIDPRNIVIINNLAWNMVISNKNLLRAEQLSRMTILRDPSNPIYLDTYGWIMYKLGDCASALFYLERAIQCSANKVDKEILSHYKEVTKKCK